MLKSSKNVEKKCKFEERERKKNLKTPYKKIKVFKSTKNMRAAKKLLMKNKFKVPIFLSA